MSDNSTFPSEQEQGDSSSKQTKQGLPVPIHPDDAKDKVFTAILKALLKMGNKPSSPKELANVIVKYKYATLGGATPFATVSSRISQHFKRAAEHNPPRPPLLAKHFDEHHSRKINYSLATEPPSTPPSHEPPSPPLSQPPAQPLRQSKRHRKAPSPQQLSELSSDEEDMIPRRRTRRQQVEDQDDDDESDHFVQDADDESEADESKRVAKRIRHHLPLSPVTASSSSSFASYSPPTGGAKHKLHEPTVTAAVLSPMDVSDEESEAEYSDYHEEMLKGDEAMADIDLNARRRSSVHITRRPSIAQAMTEMHQRIVPEAGSSSPRLSARRQSFSLMGDDIWNVNNANYDHDFDPVFLDPSTAHQLPFNIATPESVSVAELEAYFNGDNGSPSSSSPPSSSSSSSPSALPQFPIQPLPVNIPSAARTTSRKSFSAMMGCRETSLLQRALLASTARGMAEAAAAVATSSEAGDLDEVDEPEIVTRPRRKSWPDESTTSGASLFDEDPKEEEDDEDEDEEIKPKDNELPEKKKPSPANQHDRFTIIRKTFGPLECYQLDSPDDIPDTKVLRFIASTDGATEHVALRTRHAADSAKDRRNSQHFYLDQGYVNATQLRKAARPVLGKGSFDAAAEAEEGRVVVTLTKGPLECRGAWVPLSRARELVEEFEIESSPGLTKLLSDEPMDGQDDEDDDQNDDDVDRHNDTKQGDHAPVEDATQPPSISTSSQLTVDDDDESFVKFEEDDDNTSKKPEAIAVNTLVAPPVAPKTSPETPSPLDILKSLSIPNLNIAALQQMTAAIPGLAHLSSTFDLAKTLAAYMQSINKSPSSSSSDFKAALARFPALETLLRKDTPPSTPSSPVVNTTDPQIVHTTVPTNPPMYITVVDSIPVCVAVLAPTDTMPEYRIMRRLDSGYINGTKLLTAGGIDTESERSMILSFEMERRRMPRKKSELYGTWIPLRRAQELAVTCSIQHRLGPFLSDSIESYFPTPLPIVVAPRRPSSNKVASLTLQALRATNGTSSNNAPSRAVSPPTQTTSALHQFLLSGNGRKFAEFAQKAPLLGTFDDDDDEDKRTISVIDSSRASSTSTAKRKRKQPKNDESGSDVDIVNSDESEDEDDVDTDTDTDVEEVRLRMKRMRDAAIDAMESGSSIDLEELLRRASSPIVENPRRQMTATRPNTMRRHGKATARRRPQGPGRSVSGKIAPSALKKSASWSGSLTSPLRVVVPTKKLQNKKHSTRPSKLRHNTAAEEVMANRVVEHTPATSTTTTTTAATVTTPATAPTPPKATDVLATIQEDDEDEEIDIGGSDRDDDLR